MQGPVSAEGQDPEQEGEQQLQPGTSAPAALELRAPAGLRAPPHAALALPGEVEPVQLRRDLQEGLAFGLREEEASVDCSTQADPEERRIEEVGQDLLGRKRALGSWCGSAWQKAPGHVVLSNLSVGSDKPHHLQPPSAREGASHGVLTLTGTLKQGAPKEGLP